MKSRLSLKTWLVLILAAGFFLRLGYLWSIRDVIDPDEAVIGLMARNILAGERPVFMYGQAYNGSLEPLLIAPVFAFFGSNPVTLRIPALFLSVLFVGLLGILAWRMYGPREGVIALLLAAIGPAALTGMSIISWGNYVENLVLTCLIFLLAHEIAFRTTKEDRRRRRRLFAAFGLVAGIGWWTHPSVLVPLAVSGLFLFLEDKLIVFRVHFWIGAACFFLGSLPLWIYNIQYGFPTLELLVKSGGHFRSGNLQNLFRKMVPAALGVTWFGSIKHFGREMLVPLVSWIQYVILAALFLLFILTRVKRILAPVALRLNRADGSAMLVFYIALFVWVFCTSKYGKWGDALRYLLPLYVALIPALSAAISWIWARSKPAAVGILSLIVGMNLFGHASAFAVNRSPKGMERFGIRTDDPILDFFREKDEKFFYADHNYWTTISFLSGEKIIGSDPNPFRTILADPRYRRYPPFAGKVDGADRVAWVVKRSTERFDYVLDTLRAKFVRTEFPRRVVYQEFSPPDMTFSPIPSKGWTALGEGNREEVGAAFDRNVWTSWTSRATQSPDVDFVVDLGEPKRLNRVSFFCGSLRSRDYSRGFEVQVSLDGRQWTTVGTNPRFKRGGYYWDGDTIKADFSGRAIVIFDPVEARYMRIGLLDENDYTWSIAELFIYGPGEGKGSGTSGGFSDLMKEAGWLEKSGRRPEASRRLFLAILEEPDREEPHVQLEQLLIRMQVDPVRWLIDWSEGEMDNGNKLRAVKLMERAYQLAPSNLILAERLRTLYEEVGDTKGMEQFSREFFERWTPERKAFVNFGPLTLVGYDLDPAGVSPGQGLEITYYWQGIKRMDREWVVFVHFQSGDRIHHDDHYPRDGRRMTTSWRKGEIILDKRSVVIPKDFSPGICEIGVGLWDPKTGERLPVKKTDLPVRDDKVLIGTVEIK